MLKQIMMCVTVMALVAGCQSSAEQLGGKSSPNLPPGENHFLKTIANANQAEIEMSQIALNKSQSAQVRQFAQHMIDDHTQATAQVQQLASQKGFELPTQLDTLHRGMVDEVAARSGTDFDRTFIQDQVRAHQDTIDNTEREADNGSDPDVKALAQKLLPTLRMHLQMAKNVQAAL